LSFVPAIAQHNTDGMKKVPIEMISVLHRYLSIYKISLPSNAEVISKIIGVRA